MRPQLDALIQYADAHLADTPPALIGDYEGKGDLLQDPYLVSALCYAFLGVVTGDMRYREAGKKWALALAGMKDWVGILDPRGKCSNCGYPEGWGVTALAVAYDWLHDDYSEGERALIRAKIGAVCSGLHEGTLDGEWWTGANLHHDTWIPIGGLGVGAMAVFDELPDAPRWAERAKDALAEALDWLDGDGAWPEGPCGWAFAMISAVPFWDAYRIRFPVRAGAFLGHPWLQRTASFRIHARTPDGRFLGFGDCAPHGGYQQNALQAAPTLRWLAARYRDAHAQWQAAREWEKVPNPYTAAWEILWMDPGVGEAPPTDLPSGALFENQGMTFTRTGWSAGATVVAFRSDSLIGRRAASLYRPGKEERFNNSTTHVHADANSFAVWARGEFAIATARYGQKSSDLSNTLLVDGQGQYTRFGPDHVGRPDAMVTAFFASRFASLVAGEAARAYRPGLDRYARRVLLVDPGVVLVADEVDAQAPVDLEWRFHVEGEARLDLDADGFTSVLGGKTTIVRFASPRGAPLRQLADAYRRAVAINPGGRRAHADLGVVVVPSLPEGAGARIETPAESAFVIEALGATVLAAFARRGAMPEVPGRLAADGSAAAVSIGAGGVSFFAAAATRLARDGSPLFGASIPITLSYRRTGGGGFLTVAAPSPAHLTIEAGFRATGARDEIGLPVPFTPAGTRVTAKVPAGTTRIALS
ncbi:MAG: heparinase II/III family protein [Minicystis sp.]